MNSDYNKYNYYTRWNCADSFYEQKRDEFHEERNILGIVCLIIAFLMLSYIMNYFYTLLSEPYKQISIACFLCTSVIVFGARLIYLTAKIHLVKRYPEKYIPYFLYGNESVAYTYSVQKNITVDTNKDFLKEITLPDGITYEKVLHSEFYQTTVQRMQKIEKRFGAESPHAKQFRAAIKEIIINECADGNYSLFQ